MDAKIENRDIILNNTGDYLMTDGFEEIVQQIMININVPKETFIYDRSLGSYCRELNNAKDLKTLEMLVNESLVNMNGVYVKIKEAEKISTGLKLYLNISYKELNADREVIIYGYLQ